MDPAQTSVAKEAAGVAGPPGALVKALLEYQRLGVVELQEMSRMLTELGTLYKQRIHESKGVFKVVIRYRNAAGAAVGFAGIMDENINEVAKEKMRALSLVTSPVGAVGADPETDAVYVKFGRGMGFEGAENIPSNFDLVFKRGDKVNRLITPQGVEHVQLYSLRSFDAVLYITAGAPEALPSF